MVVCGCSRAARCSPTGTATSSACSLPASSPACSVSSTRSGTRTTSRRARPTTLLAVPNHEMHLLRDKHPAIVLACELQIARRMQMLYERLFADPGMPLETRVANMLVTVGRLYGHAVGPQSNWSSSCRRPTSPMDRPEPAACQFRAQAAGERAADPAALFDADDHRPGRARGPRRALTATAGHAWHALSTSWRPWRLGSKRMSPRFAHPIDRLRFRPRSSAPPGCRCSPRCSACRRTAGRPRRSPGCTPRSAAPSAGRSGRTTRRLAFGPAPCRRRC